ncbi:dermonecrotic toxin [Striga asiatica]|uniref:Dermonecrotic toxin n=1 Tax=Striga asiatica TaxID=4170 RepID=A0A5A7QVX8_STRAF|nr:dermonecrotic toxin [Striga asiatica]
MERSLNLVADAIEKAEQDGKKTVREDSSLTNSQINSGKPIHVATFSSSHSTSQIDANKGKTLRKSYIKEDDDIVISSDGDDITISIMRKKMYLKKKSTPKKISLLKNIKKGKN